MTITSAPSPIDAPAKEPLPRRLLGRITRIELIIGAVMAVVMLALVVIEPNILEAPFENERTLLFTAGGTLLAAGAFVVMLWLRIPAAVRVVVLLVPFVLVNWWLLSPYFIDDVVDEEFSTSIAAQAAATDETAPAPTEPVVVDDGSTAEVTDATGDEGASDQEPVEAEPAAEPVPDTPVLIGAGQFVGLAGHDGTGDAGIFRDPDGSFVLRFENFDIENGPDLEVYLVPGADQTDLAEGSIHLGALKGNVGDQNYELPAGTELSPGPYTVLVWCEAFSVEFVGATVEL